MHALEGTQDLARDIDRDADRQELVFLPELAQEAVAVDPVDVLHREVRLAAGIAPGMEDGHDVLVRDRRVQSRLAFEHRAPLRIVREVREQSLHDELRREVRTNFGRPREVHLGRASDRDARVEEERAEAMRGRHPYTRAKG